MFLKNSFLILELFLCCFSFSFGNSNKKQEIIIPKLNIEKKIKNFTKEIHLKEDLNRLQYNDKIIIKDKDNLYYYKVIGKYQDISNLSFQDTSLILYSDTTIVVAINTGKLLKKES